MKNLLFIAILCIGFVTMSQAQTLKYHVYNNSNLQCYWAFSDAGPSAVVYELNILPGQTRSGGIANFSFPLEWKAGSYTSPNCYVTTIDAGPILATTLPTACPGVNVTYKIVEIVPFVYYVYKGIFG